MAPKHFEYMREVSLMDYLTPDLVRTVPGRLGITPGGYSEVPLAIHLKEPTVKKLSFHVPWDGEICGFIRKKELLKEKAGIEIPLKLVTLSDWDDHFAFIIETEVIHQAAAFSVSTDEVVYLLENCRRCPDHQ